MPRARALILLALFVLNQDACTSWQLPKVTPQAYVAQHPGKTIRVTVTTGIYQKNVVLKGVRFSGDSVFGRDPTDQPVAFSLQQVAGVEVREQDGRRTALAVIGIGATVLAILTAIALNSCPGAAC